MILVVNPGSSSIKFSLYEYKDEKSIKKISDGIAEQIKVNGKVIINYQNKKHEFEVKLPNHKIAIETILNKLDELNIIKDIKDINGVGYRTVHGGTISKSSIIDEIVHKKIEESSKLAPLHNPPGLLVIDKFKDFLPHAIHVACFDTAYHQTMPEINYIYPVNYDWYEKHGVRKYGFHGTSFDYINRKYEEIVNKKNNNIVVCHLGNGASICSIKEGKSFDTTMGLTPLAGIMMGSRSGDIDPSIINYMSNELNASVSQINDMLNNESGLLGISKVSSDIRYVIDGYKKDDKMCKLALELYTQKIANFVIQMVNQQEGKVESIIFTAGIGENAKDIVSMIISKLYLLDIKLDLNKNNESYEDNIKISKDESKISVYKIRTNEEIMICRDVISFLNK
ncbi:acetate kinase [Spiroplasma litorale]|uniref:Acetate kinase n=1 Tax=Spiroplasma litorale TaxID=216942 RepID=A0A0K1W326_9MOLU|nr:acetate/propionate family kinase [Spiroplasma litorale]AKX34725.1 acetate kinase [Spiroplasma litorale]